MVEIALQIRQCVSEVLKLICFDNHSRHRVEPLMHTYPSSLTLGGRWFRLQRQNESIAVSLVETDDTRMVISLYSVGGVSDKGLLIIADKMMAGRIGGHL